MQGNRGKKNLNKMVAWVYKCSFGLCLHPFYVVAQCLLTVEGGFVHAQIISGVSVPLGLWKPSLTIINRSAGRMLRLTGGRRSPPQSQDRTNSWPIYDVPNTHSMRLHTHIAIHTSVFFTGKQSFCNPRIKEKAHLTLTENLQDCFPIFVAITCLRNRGIFIPPVLTREMTQKFHSSPKFIQKVSRVTNYLPSSGRNLSSLAVCHHMAKNNSICILSDVILCLLFNGRVNLPVSCEPKSAFFLKRNKRSTCSFFKKDG